MSLCRILGALLLQGGVFVSYAAGQPSVPTLAEQVAALPEGFREHFFDTPLSARVQLDSQVLGDAMIMISTDNKVRLLSFTDVHDSTLPETVRQRWLKALDTPTTLGQCGQECPADVVAIAYQLDSAQLSLLTSQGEMKEHQWHALPEQQSLGVILANQFHLSDGNEQDPAMGWSLDLEAGLGEWTLLGRGQVDRSDGSQLNHRLTASYGERELEGHFLRAGLFTPDSQGVLRRPYTVGGRAQTMTGMMLGTSDVRRVQGPVASLYPIYVTANRDSVAEVYRDGVLISSQPLSAGLQTLDSSLLPGGIYDVEVRVVENGNIISKNQETVHKPGAWADPAQRLRYNLFAGRESQWLSNLADSQQDEWSLGGSINYLLDSRWIGGAAAQQVGSEYQLGLSLDWEANRDIKLFGNLYHSSETGQGFSTQALWRYDGGSLTANHSQQWRDQNGLHGTDASVVERSSSVSLNQRVMDNHNVTARVSSGNNGMGYDLGWHVRQPLGETQINWQLSMFERPYEEGGERRNRGGMLTASFTLGGTKRHGSLSIGSHTDSRGERSHSLSGTVSQHWESGPFTESSATLTVDNQGLGLGSWNRFDQPQATGTVWGQSSPDGLLSGGLNLSSTLVAGDGAVVLSGNNTNRGAGVIVEVISDDPKAELIAQHPRGSIKLKPGNNFIPVEAWKEGTLELDFPEADAPALSISPRQLNYHLTRGGVARQQVRVMETVTVMGRVVGQDGLPVAGARVVNHAGRSVTEHDGIFTLEMHLHTPQVEIEHPDGERCDISLPMSRERREQVLFAGALSCSTPRSLTEG